MKNLDTLQVIDHIGDGANAAVVRGLLINQELALKFLDPRCVNADVREREYRQFRHKNLIRIEKMYNLIDFGYAHVPDWFYKILDCQPTESFVAHPVTDCITVPNNYRQGESDKTISEFGVDGFFMLAMEYCPITLSDHIKYVDSMEEIQKILVEVCSGLTAMHKQGIIHTDIKIDNIFVTSEGVIKIGDYGLSERWKIGIRGIIRDPEVAAPELGGGEGGPYSDIYSLGLLGHKLAELSNVKVPRKFVEICNQACEHIPEERFSTVDDFLEGLNKI